MRIEVAMLPPSELSPNARCHWAEKYQAGRLYQAAVFYECIDARNKLISLPYRDGFPPFRRARLTLTFLFPNCRRRDEDNLRARFKPGQDAIVQAGLIQGDSTDNLVLGEINIIVDKERAPLTIIELAEIKKLEG